MIFKGIHVDGDMFLWDDDGEHQVCSGEVHLILTNGQVQIKTGPGVDVTLLKHHRPKIGDFLGIYFTDLSGLSTQSHGILGMLTLL